MTDSIEKLIADMRQWCLYDGASAEQNVTVWASRLEALCREPPAPDIHFTEAALLVVLRIMCNVKPDAEIDPSDFSEAEINRAKALLWQLSMLPAAPQPEVKP